MTTEINLVSPPFSSGAAWLVNALLSLGVKCTNVGFLGKHWLADKNRHVVANDAWDHLSWHLPTLHTQREFSFREDIEVFWEHRLDMAAYGDRKTILFVRDPRDAIYSLYKRHYENTMGYGEYLDRPDMWPDHFPGMFGMPPPETWAMFIAFWTAAIPSKKRLIVRFEDVKANGDCELRTVLDFLTLDRSESEISDAVSASRFEAARAAMKRRERETKNEVLVARRGATEEWKHSHSQTDLERFRGICASVMGDLGYEIQSDFTGTGKFEPAFSEEADLIIDLAVSKFAPDWSRIRLFLRQATCGAGQMHSLDLGSVVAKWMQLVFEGRNCQHLDQARIFFKLYKLLSGVRDTQAMTKVLKFYPP